MEGAAARGRPQPAAVHKLDISIKHCNSRLQITRIESHTHTHTHTHLWSEGACGQLFTRAYMPWDSPIICCCCCCTTRFAADVQRCCLRALHDSRPQFHAHMQLATDTSKPPARQRRQQHSAITNTVKNGLSETRRGSPQLVGDVATMYYSTTTASSPGFQL